MQGVRNGLKQHWAWLEALHSEERLTCGQIAWIFGECSRLPTLDTGGQSRRPLANGERPLGARLVQLVTNFVCERVPELTPEEITTFVVALTSTALPMDEFWLFMMAKRIQDTSLSFTAEQIVLIAQRYADNALEDDEFFEALAARIAGAPGEATVAQLAGLLLSCAKVRFLHEDLCRLALPLLEDPARTAALQSEALAAALTACALLDQRQFKPWAVCRELAMRPKDLRRTVAKVELSMGMAIAAVCLRDAAGVRLVLPLLLRKMEEAFVSGRSLGKRGRREASAVQRRVMLMGLCAAYGVPRRSAWALPLMKQVKDTMDALQEQLDIDGKDSWEPQPSSFHLEVVAVLKLLDVEHTVEHPHRPFCLDLAITPQQLRAAERSWAAAGAA